MTPKSIAVLGVCAVISVAAATYGVSQRVGFQTTDFQGQRVFPDLVSESSSVREVVVTQGGVTKTFRLEGDQWRLAESDGYPVHNNLVTKVMFGLSNMEYLEAKTANPSRHPELQLEPPLTKAANSQQVTLKDAAGDVIAELLVGRANYFLPETTTGGMYIRKPDEDQTWLVRGLVDIGVETRDWLQRDIVDLPIEDVVKVTVTHPNGEIQVIEPKPVVTGGFAFANLPDGRKLSSQFAPRNIAAIVDSFVLNNVRATANVSLNAADAYVGVYDMRDGSQITLRMWQQDDTQYLRVGAAYNGSEPGSEAAKAVAELNMRADGWTYIVPEYQFEQISKPFDAVTEPLDSGS